MEVLKVDAASRGARHRRGETRVAAIAAGAVAHAAPCGATGPGSDRGVVQLVIWKGAGEPRGGSSPAGG